MSSRQCHALQQGAPTRRTTSSAGLPKAPTMLLTGRDLSSGVPVLCVAGPYYRELFLSLMFPIAERGGFGESLLGAGVLPF